ncbi:MAG: DUF721 domain-containing protein [Cytophagales bacterium]
MSDRERGKVHSVKESIGEFLDKYALRESYNLSEIKTLWTGVMGQTVAKRTSNFFFRDQKLMVQIDSAALKHQLHMNRSNIREKLNKAIGKEYIAEVVIL